MNRLLDLFAVVGFPPAIAGYACLGDWRTVTGLLVCAGTYYIVTRKETDNE